MKQFLLTSVLLLGAATVQADTTVRVRDTGGPSIDQVQAMDAHGPQARIAVARFENKSADSRSWWNPQIGDGMADMLTTALVNTGRFIVLERGEALEDILGEQDLGASGRVRADTAAPIGEMEGAELLVVAAVTEFDENSGGTRGGLGGFGGRVLGAIAGGTKSAHMAIDLRLVDARTSRVLAATSVEGEAKDFKLGGALGGYTGSVALGGALETWKNTPREKALRQVIGAAVEYVVARTPAQYYRGGQQTAAAAATSAAPASTSATGGGSAGGSDQIVITAASAPAYQGPNINTPVKFSLPAGTITVARVRVKGWIQVADSNGQLGWVAEDSAVPVE
ncbi:MAG: hypothetical protein Tsb002_21420 [Wenzhouxiangellaceae bacterium]